MELQNIMEVATKDVITISEDEMVSTAIEMMYENNHRDIIVLSKGHNKFGLCKKSNRTNYTRGTFIKNLFKMGESYEKYS
jgi:CBS domain-containing protein